VSADDRSREPAREEEASPDSGGIAAGSHEILGRALSWLTVADASPDLERHLLELAGSIRHLGEQPPGAETLLALETRRLAGGSTAPEGTDAEVWSRYSHAQKAWLTEPEASLLREDLARVAADPGPALAGGRLIRYRLREVLDELDIPPAKAAGLLLDDLRDSLAARSAKRLAWRGPTTQTSGWARSRASALTKNLFDTVFRDMEGEVARLGKTVTRPGGEISLKRMSRQLSLPEQDMLASFSKLGGAASEAKVPVSGAGASEAREVVRLLERLLELARRYTVDLVGVLEHYLESARRIVREAQDLQGRRQLANDRQAIERALADLDPQLVAEGVAALPLYLHRHGGAGEDAYGTVLLPRLGNEMLTRSFTRLCRRLLHQPDQQETATLAAAGPSEGTTTAL
jgi:hypothetical protein